MNRTFNHDLNYIFSSNINFKRFENKSILITGATGLIGSNIVKSFVAAKRLLGVNVNIIAFVRSLEKAGRVFEGECEDISFIYGDITKGLEYGGNVDYIIHAAAKTSSIGFVTSPVETIITAVKGTTNVLSFAKDKSVKKIVYLSTMEVYGTPNTDEIIDENFCTNLNTMAVRSCYPESKRICENLCVSYLQEYGLPVNVVRLTQTFGAGVEYNDGRIFAEFARCVIEKQDIILHTTGETKRNYLYTADAVTAILTVLLDGANGEAYNAANEDTYCSIYDMAQLVAQECARGQITVKRVIDDTGKFGYAPALKMNLSTAKLRGLGWESKISLLQMFNRMIDDMRNKYTGRLLI